MCERDAFGYPNSDNTYQRKPGLNSGANSHLSVVPIYGD